MRKHLSCLSPIWRQCVWTPFEVHRHQLTWRIWRINTAGLLVYIDEICIKCWRLWHFNAVSGYERFLTVISKVGLHDQALWQTYCALFSAVLVCWRHWCLHWTPFRRRWWLSLGFPTWKRSIQLISGSNCTPKAQWHLVRSVQHLPLDSEVWKDAWMVGVLSPNMKNIAGALLQPFFSRLDTNWNWTRLKEIFVLGLLKWFTQRNQLGTLNEWRFLFGFLPLKAELVSGLHGPYLR